MYGRKSKALLWAQDPDDRPAYLYRTTKRFSTLWCVALVVVVYRRVLISDSDACIGDTQ
jgi:hypothetical protein